MFLYVFVFSAPRDQLKSKHSCDIGKIIHPDAMMLLAIQNKTKNYKKIFIFENK